MLRYIYTACRADCIIPPYPDGPYGKTVMPYSSVSQPPGRGPVPGPGINYAGPREILLELITNLNVILYLSTRHTAHIIVLGPVLGTGINYAGPREILLELITNLHVILYLSTCHTVHIIVLGTVPGPGINYAGPREILLELITNLNVILYLSTCHTVHIIVLILFMIMP